MRKRALVAQCARDRDALAATWKRAADAIGIRAVLQELGSALAKHPLMVTAISTLFVSGYSGKLASSLGGFWQLWKAASPVWLWWSDRRARR